MTHAEMIFSNDPWLDDFLNHCHLRNYATKTPVIRPTDPADTLFYLVSGSLAVTSEDEDGKEFILAYLKPGEFIGELGLFIPASKRDVSVVTRSECVVGEIGYARLRHLLETDLKIHASSILFGLGKQISERLSYTSRKMTRLAFMDVSGRVARTFLELCDEPDAIASEDGIELRITRQELSLLVGCSREMIGKVVKDLEEQGIIEINGRKIIIRRDNFYDSLGIRHEFQLEDSANR